MTSSSAMTSPVIARHAGALEAFRIAEGDSNYFACLFDPVADGVSFTMVVEIFEKGGATPPNSHSYAEECFFVLAGTGIAECAGATLPIAPGRQLHAAPRLRAQGHEHGAGKALLPHLHDAERRLRGSSSATGSPCRSMPRISR